MTPQRGEVYWIYKNGVETHPYIVVSNEPFNRGNYFVGVPLTSQDVATRSDLDNCVHFDQGECNLPKECVAQAELCALIERDEIVHGPTGSLDAAKQREMILALGVVLGFTVEMS